MVECIRLLIERLGVRVPPLEPKFKNSKGRLKRRCSSEQNENKITTHSKFAAIFIFSMKKSELKEIIKECLLEEFEYQNHKKIKKQLLKRAGILIQEMKEIAKEEFGI
jgi:hypothetical protein